MTVRVLCWTLAAVSIVATCSSGRASDRTPLKIPNRRAVAAGFGFDLGENGGQEPRVWDGPIVITDPNRRTCRVSEDVELVNRPVTLWRDRLLYVDTTSGSTSIFYVVDIRNCRTAWSSPAYYGPPAVIDDDHLRLTGFKPCASAAMVCRRGAAPDDI